MVKHIERKALLLSMILFVCFLCKFGTSSPLDSSNILKKVEAKYAKFNKEIEDMTIVMESTTPEGEDIATTKQLWKGEKFRSESTMGGEIYAITIYDGENTWVITPQGKRKVSAEMKTQYTIQFNWWREISEKAKVVGTEKIESKECYVIEIKDGSLLTRLWIDKKNYVLIKYVTKGVESPMPEIITTYSDFKKIKGNWQMPYLLEAYIGNKLLAIVKVKSIEINKNLSDELFNHEKVKVKARSFGIFGIPNLKNLKNLKKMIEESEIEELEQELEQ